MGIALTQTPPQYTQYVAQAFEWFKEHKMITHKDITKLTGCNCSYSVISALRNKCRMIETWSTEGKRHKVYWFNGVKNNETTVNERRP